MMNVNDFFKNALLKERVSHLYLLHGKIGSGKLEIAHNFSKLILKTGGDKKQEELIETDNYSQVYHIKPDENSIKKNQILSLQEEFSKTSLLNEPRIYIIEDIDTITDDGANSLLKFMEEPQNKDVYGLLLTTNIDRVIPTIISRSQVIKVFKENNAIIEEILLKETENVYLVKTIVSLTQDLETAREYSNDFNLDLIVSFMNDYFINFNSKNFHPISEINKNLSNVLYDKKYYRLFLEILLLNFLELLKYIVNTKYDFTFNEEIYEKIKNNVSEEKIYYIIDLIKEEISKSRFNINIALSLEVLMMMIDKERV